MHACCSISQSLNITISTACMLYYYFKFLHFSSVSNISPFLTLGTKVHRNNYYLLCRTEPQPMQTLSINLSDAWFCINATKFQLWHQGPSVIIASTSQPLRRIPVQAFCCTSLVSHAMWLTAKQHEKLPLTAAIYSSRPHSFNNAFILISLRYKK